MSTTIYMIRHGESEANERDAFLGHHDLPLTATGRRQAQMTADFLTGHVQKPDVIYSSDLSRAYETAMATAKHVQLPIITDQGLREINAGLWENVTFAELREKFPKSFGIWQENIGLAQCDGGETVRQLQTRVVAAITRIAKKHENSVVFLFTHATPIRIVAAHCLGKSLGELKTVPWAANASVTKVVFDGQSFSLAEYSRDDFMGDLVTRLSADV